MSKTTQPRLTLAEWKIKVTVGELARLLSKYPNDLRVVVNGYEEGYDDLEEDLLIREQIRLDTGNAWWEGKHSPAWDHRGEANAVVGALVLHRPQRSSR